MRRSPRMGQQHVAGLPDGWRSIRARVGQLTTVFYLSPEGRRYATLTAALAHISSNRLAANIENNRKRRLLEEPAVMPPKRLRISLMSVENIHQPDNHPPASTAIINSTTINTTTNSNSNNNSAINSTPTSTITGTTTIISTTTTTISNTIGCASTINSTTTTSPTNSTTTTPTGSAVNPAAASMVFSFIASHSPASRTTRPLARRSLSPLASYPKAQVSEMLSINTKSRLTSSFSLRSSAPRVIKWLSSIPSPETNGYLAPEDWYQEGSAAEDQKGSSQGNGAVGDSGFEHSDQEGIAHGKGSTEVSGSAADNNEGSEADSLEGSAADDYEGSVFDSGSKGINLSEVSDGLTPASGSFIVGELELAPVKTSVAVGEAVPAAAVSQSEPEAVSGLAASGHGGPSATSGLVASSQDGPAADSGLTASATVGSTEVTLSDEVKRRRKMMALRSPYRNLLKRILVRNHSGRVNPLVNKFRKVPKF